MSTTYIIKPPRTNRRGSMVLTETLDASFSRRTRATGQTLGGMFRVVEDAGVDEQRLNVRGGRAVGLDGGQRSAPNMVLERRQSAVDKTIRRVRPDDEAKLAEKDAEVGVLREQIRALKRERADIAYAAWKRAAKVPLHEIVDRIPVPVRVA